MDGESTSKAVWCLFTLQRVSRSLFTSPSAWYTPFIEVRVKKCNIIFGYIRVDMSLNDGCGLEVLLLAGGPRDPEHFLHEIINLMYGYVEGGAPQRRSPAQHQ